MKLIIDLPDKMYENIKKRGFVSSRYYRQTHWWTERREQWVI